MPKHFTIYSVTNENVTASIFNTVGALIGMIPEGLLLLTSSVMAVSVVRLSKFKVLVQQLYCLYLYLLSIYVSQHLIGGRKHNEVSKTKKR